MPPYPEIPVPVWQQIAIVVIFSLIFVGLIWILVRIFANTVTKATADTTQLFVKAIADVNVHYAGIIHQTNSQWQLYIDARSEVAKMVDAQIIEKLASLSAGLSKMTDAIEELSRKMENHERRADERHQQLMGTTKKVDPNT